MKQPRIATITLNPAYDLVGQCSYIEQGEVNLVNSSGLYAAGKGVNVAKVLHDFGLDVIVGGFLGKENPHSFEQLFCQLNFTDKFHRVDGHTRMNVKITESNYAVTDFNFSGFSVSKANWRRFVQETLSWAKDVDMISVNGSLPFGIKLPAFTQWLCDLKKICPYLIFDSSRQAFEAGLNAIPWLVKPNKRELEIWIGHELLTQQEIINAAKKLHNLGVTHVIVSLGSDGAIWINDSENWFAKPPPCNVISTVGAGDSMVAGLMYGLLMHESTEQILRLATAVATVAVSQNNVGFNNHAALTEIASHVKMCSL